MHTRRWFLSVIASLVATPALPKQRVIYIDTEEQLLEYFGPAKRCWRCWRCFGPGPLIPWRDNILGGTWTCQKCWAERMAQEIISIQPIEGPTAELFMLRGDVAPGRCVLNEGSDAPPALTKEI